MSGRAPTGSKEPYRLVKVEIEKLNRLLDLTSEALTAHDRYEAILREEARPSTSNTKELRDESDRLFDELQDLAQELRGMVPSPGIRSD